MSKLGLKNEKAANSELISEMGAGQTFRFTSRKKEANSGFYLKLASKAIKAVNLNTFKVFEFDNTDQATPVDAELNVK